MLVETGRVVAVEEDFLWVETIRKSSCQSCTAQKGCGYGLVNTVNDANGHRIRALIVDRPEGGYQVNDTVEVQIAEQVLVSSALWAYIVPLLSMLLMAAIAANFTKSDGLTALFALSGLVIGFVIVRKRALMYQANPSYQPVVRSLKSEVPSCLVTPVEG